MSKPQVNFPQPVAAFTVYPIPPQLTFWEWIGLKPRPTVNPQRMYVAAGNTIYISDTDGNFDVSLPQADKTAQA